MRLFETLKIMLYSATKFDNTQVTKSGIIGIEC